MNDDWRAGDKPYVYGGFVDDADLAAAGFKDIGQISDWSDRVNGFAPGDRVAIVDCELAGAYGKVVESRSGCVAESCRNMCHLVFVDLMKKPEGVEEAWGRDTYVGGDDVKRFLAREVIHVD